MQIAPNNQWQPLRIMPLGDSITVGTCSHGLGGYRFPLWQAIRQANWPVQFVGSLEDGPVELAERAHEGHYGWTLVQIAAAVRGWLEQYHPDIILLHAGTNDIVLGASPAEVAQRLENTLQQISTTLPCATLFVAQVAPLGYAALNDRVIAYNRNITEVAARHAIKHVQCHCVDMHSALTRSQLADNIHPNQDGYVAMAHGWYQALERRMNGSQRSIMAVLQPSGEA